VESKHGTVSFGFLWAPRAETLKRRLKAYGGPIHTTIEAD
jgi:beta-carotene 3-hydroxylase